MEKYIGKRYGIIGSGSYRNKEFMEQYLEKTINKLKDVIVSGRSPRRKYNNVDVWAELWGRKHCFVLPKIFPAKKFTEFYFKQRNKQIAFNSDILVVFLSKRKRYESSGCWNTVKFFVDNNKFSKKNLLLYDINGKLWSFDDYPQWLKTKINYRNCKIIS